ncbi:hypothetical protein DYB32_000562 [Aphanomyces invadans]|uniref:Clu domain-containing protein n=1 Tax=Aphanomyces invadans TaxID=157072 RepID=A0A418B9P1_9STRA|nr:hypothetical protein DYB32_000562 [Aphanomyces invadans]
MGNEISQFVDHDQSIRRTPQNVVDNENRFDFCSNWEPSHVHAFVRAYTTRASQGDNGTNALLHKNQRLEVLHNEIERLESLAISMSLEDAVAGMVTDTTPPSTSASGTCPVASQGNAATPADTSVKIASKQLKFKAKPAPQTPEQVHEAFLKSTEEEYVAQRYQVLLDLEKTRHEWRALAQVPASLDGIDFSLPAQWNHYFQSVQAVDADARAGAIDKARSLWHPSSVGYAMAKDPEASAQLSAFTNAQEAALQLAAQELANPRDADGHTDNNPSMSDDNESDVDSNNDDENDGKAAGRNSAEVPIEAPLAPSSLTKFNLALHTQGTNDVVVPTFPPLFDPSLRSPVFFGYTTTRDGRFEPSTKTGRVTSFEHPDDEREHEYFEAQLQKINQRRLEATKVENGKLKALQERRDAQLDRRQKETKARQRELDDARKEGVDPTADFFRKADEKQRQLDAQEHSEDDLYESHLASITSRINGANDTAAKEIQILETLRTPHKPVGEARVAFHTEQLRVLHQNLLNAKNDLIQATAVLDQTKGRSMLQVGNSDTKSSARAQLLFAQDQVKAAEKTITVLLGQIEDEEFMLDRGESQIDQESKYFPSFEVFSKANMTLLDMAFALVIMCGAPISDKLQYMFETHKMASPDVTAIAKPALVQALIIYFRVLDRLNELATPNRLTSIFPTLDESNLANIADHMVGTKAFLTWFDFNAIAHDAIQRSKYLSTIMRVPWKYHHVSRVQQQAMAPLRQFECGLISASDLKYRLASQMLSARGVLTRSSKETLHVRALAMGSNDPLKADYSKYLKFRRSKVLSNVVSLDHACFKNLIVYRTEVAERAAIRLQTTWRAKKGRYDATMAARKQAFYHAKGMALKEARESVENEWRRQDAVTETTMDKMKFDAKIRMRQVKLRTKGLAFSRDEVLKVMVEEAVQDSMEEVDHRFREMEESAGYCPRVLRFDPLDQSHFSEIAHSLIDQLQRVRLPAPATAKLMRAIAEKEAKEKKEVPETPLCTPEAIVVDNVQLYHDSVKEKKLRKEACHGLMLRGCIPVLASCSNKERREWMAMTASNPPLNAWCDRLQFVCDGMTKLKLQELLMELPSKRHAMAYVQVFQNTLGVFDQESLIDDLMGHFRILRGVESLADALIQMAQSDMETHWRQDIFHHLNSQETFLHAHVRAVHKAQGAQMLRDAKQRGRDLDAKHRMDLDVQRNLTLDAKTRAEEAIAKWKAAEFSLSQAQRRMEVREAADVVVQRRDRILWAERLKRALEAPEKGVHTYVEVIHVCQDFLEVARHVAMQIVREYYVPVHEKTIWPLPGKFAMDGRNDGNVRSSDGRGLKYEAHNIRFHVALDDHGRFDGSDELSAKFASAECRNSSLYLPMMMLTRNVLVPLQCCVDYHGMRVLCVSKLPIECFDVSDKGTVQNVRTEFVYGTSNKGQTVICHSKTLDASIAKVSKICWLTNVAESDAQQVNATLNLAAHCVRGSLDLTAKLIHGAGDMNGYIGRDETFCLLKFRRMMPPEDPDETPHLPASTRSMSILWRQLRPALVQTNPVALSADALSLFTYQTPDWETQATRVKECTQRMIRDVIPSFARKLAEREVSDNIDDVFTDKVVTVDRPYPGDSCQHVAIYKGDVRSRHDVRGMLLVEMIQRTIKNLIRLSLRTMLQSRQLAVGPSQQSLFVVILNYVSGSGAGSDLFWKTQVFDGIRARFGSVAVSYVDRLNLRHAPVAITRYLSSTIGFELTTDCWNRFTQHPDGFAFTTDDVKLDVPCCVSHNLLVLHFAAASLLLDKASHVQGATYQAAILLDSPCGYWPLNERRGSTVAKNLVSSTDHGKFSSTCALEAAGPIANDDLSRAVEFFKDSPGYITFSKAKKWDQGATLEAWASVSATGHGVRAIVSHGRFTLAVLKRNVWGAWINMNNIDVVVAGPPITPDVWTHVSSSFDGTTLQLYVNGVLYGDIDVQSEVDAQLERREKRVRCRLLYQTKEGKRLVKDLAKKLADELAFKDRLKKRSTPDTPDDDTSANVAKTTKADMETMAKKQYAMDTFNKKTASFQKLRDELKEKIALELADEMSQDGRPLRIGCVSNSSSNSKFFVGKLCHVVFYSRCLDRDVIMHHWIMGTLDRAWKSDALFELSAMRFTKALEFAPTDGPMLASFAVNICSALKYDLEQNRSQNMYKSKVRRALRAFRSTENHEGCAEILRNLPRDVRFSDLFREAYACVNELHPTYWTRASNVSLLDLDALPPHFFMSGETKSLSMAGLLREEIAVFADIIRRVIAEYPTHYGDGLTDLKWVLDLETDSVVVYFILWVRAGEDSRRIDLSGVRDVTAHDMDVISAANRSCLAFNLNECTNVTTKSMCTLSLRCGALESLNAGGISHLTDDVLIAISKTCPNLKALTMDRCPLITDDGVVALEKCHDLREAVFSHCARITDDSLLSLATHPRLARLELAFCLQLSDFVSLSNLPASVTLTSLDISGCRRLTDDGIMAIGTRCPKLTCALTHHCLDLAHLNVQDLHLLTDKVFTFDQEGDGRTVVAKTLLTKLETIVLADCKTLTDTGIAYLMHRARHLRSMDASGCFHLTDQGLRCITSDIFNGTSTGEHLRVLDLSYCMALTSEGLHHIRERCKHLVTVYLTGCVLLQDAEVIELVKSCGKISNLGLGFCRELTDDVLIAIADCLWLDALLINRCSKMTDVGICAIASQCTGLVALNLSSCKRITNVSLDTLFDNCPKLNQLDVTYCPHVTSAATSRFATNRINMTLRTDCQPSAQNQPPATTLEDEKAQEKLFRQNSNTGRIVALSSRDTVAVDTGPRGDSDVPPQL